MASTDVGTPSLRAFLDAFNADNVTPCPTKDEDDDEEFEPLELFLTRSHQSPDPDVGGPSVVRLFLGPGGHGGWPGGGISDVFVIEGDDRSPSDSRGGRSTGRPRMG
jgi:hypothetical protein